MASDGPQKLHEAVVGSRLYYNDSQFHLGFLIFKVVYQAEEGGECWIQSKPGYEYYFKNEFKLPCLYAEGWNPKKGHTSIITLTTEVAADLLRQSHFDDPVLLEILDLNSENMGQRSTVLLEIVDGKVVGKKAVYYDKKPLDYSPRRKISFDSFVFRFF